MLFRCTAGLQEHIGPAPRAAVFSRPKRVCSGTVERTRTAITFAENANGALQPPKAYNSTGRTLVFITSKRHDEDGDSAPAAGNASYVCLCYRWSLVTMLYRELIL